jgi:hypothetical protein
MSSRLPCTSSCRCRTTESLHMFFLTMYFVLPCRTTGSLHMSFLLPCTSSYHCRTAGCLHMSFLLPCTSSYHCRTTGSLHMSYLLRIRTSCRVCGLCCTNRQAVALKLYRSVCWHKCAQVCVTVQASGTTKAS